MSLIFPRRRHESLSNVNSNTLSLYVELVHDFIVIVRIKCCVWIKLNSLSTPGCILCELLTGYPLLPGEDEGKNLFYILRVQKMLTLCFICRGSAVVYHWAFRNATTKIVRPVKASEKFHILQGCVIIISSFDRVYSNIFIEMLSEHRIKINFGQLTICYLQATLATARRRLFLTGRQFLTEGDQDEASPGVLLAPESFRPPSRVAMIRSSLTSSAGVWSGSPLPGWHLMPPSDTPGSGGGYPGHLRYRYVPFQGSLMGFKIVPIQPGRP